MDNHRERIANFKIEPPGLFRGRGNHPKMGMLKRRIMPEDIIINCSKWAQNSLGGEVGAGLFPQGWLLGLFLVLWERCSACTGRSPKFVQDWGQDERGHGLSLFISFSFWMVMFIETQRFLLPLLDINGRKSDMITRLLGWSPGQRISKVLSNISCWIPVHESR